MNNVLELTNLLVKGKRIERVSGHLASKVRLTPATAISFRKNIDTGLVKNAIEKYNATYAELRNAVVSAEVALAEQEARDKALVNPSVQNEEAARTARIEEDNTVAKLTSPHLVKRRFNILSIEVDKLAGRFGTLGNNFGVNVKKGYIPKALSIPSLYSKIYLGISKKSDIYKLADQLIDADPNLIHSQGEGQKTVANWRNLFANSDANKTSQLNVVTDEREEKEEELFVPVESKGLTKEELSHRKLMGQLGDELQEIRKIEISPNGIVSPFNNGLIERENSLLSMLSNLSGVESIAKRKVKDSPRKDNTEFQNLIDRIVGYKDPVSDEEHKKEEESLQQYYSNPEVSEIIDNLRHKDMLFTFNQPESYNKIMEAERKDNERKASLSTTVDILNSEDELIDTQPLEVSKAVIQEAPKETAMEQLIQSTVSTTPEIEKLEVAPMLANFETKVETEVKQPELLVENKEIENAKKSVEQEKVAEHEVKSKIDEEKQEAEREKERQQLIVGAEEQARILQEQIEHDNLILGAEEQAQMLQKENEKIELIEGAEEQAKMLKTLYDYMDKQEEMTKIAEQEKQELIKGAEEQARILQEQIEHDNLILGAEEQAQMLQKENEKIKLTENEQEQARLLQNKNEQVELTNQAQTQDQMLNETPDEIDTMEELASQIVYQNTNVDEDDVKVGAEEQAKLLYEKNEHADLVSSAENQARMIYESAKPQTTIEQKLGPNVQLLSTTDRYSNIVSASKPLKLRQAQMKNLNDSLNSSLNVTLEKKKELLNSLKQQLQGANEEEVSFLKYNENMVKAA